MKRIVTGITIVLAGVMILLSNINVFNFGPVFADWWPVLLIGAGLLMLVNDSKNYVWGIFISGLGVLFLVNTLDIARVDVGDIFFPAVLVAVGLSILLKGSGSVARRVSEKNDEDITAVLGGSLHKNTSPDYRGGKVTVVMGGVEIDLSKAMIKKDASLDVFALMGGVELRVPENVIVKSRAAVVMGSIEDKTIPMRSEDAPVLYLDGMLIMAGIEIKR
jgi:predicted membrane protein